MTVLAVAGCGARSAEQPGPPPSTVANTPSTGSPDPTGGVPYTDNRKLEMTGPPPAGRVRGDDRVLDVIAVDWTALGGANRVPSPPVRWQERTPTGDPEQITIDTTQLPIRVVVYAYPTVDGSGVPDESSGAEHRCDVSPGSWCSYESAGRTRITLPPQPSGTYVVVQAAWITSQGADVQLSYAWRTARA